MGINDLDADRRASCRAVTNRCRAAFAAEFWRQLREDAMANEEARSLLPGVAQVYVTDGHGRIVAVRWLEGGRSWSAYLSVDA